MPAKAGIQVEWRGQAWIPAFAGMTREQNLRAADRLSATVVQDAACLWIDTGGIFGDWLCCYGEAAMVDWSFVNRENAAYIEEMYERYRADPGSVGPDWALFFAGFELGADGRRGPAVAGGGPRELPEKTIGVFDLIHSYRELGHLIANLDPLGHNRTSHPLLELSEFGFEDGDLERTVECPSFKGCQKATLGELVERLRETYCRTLGVEYMFIEDKEQRTWLQERMEPSHNRPDLGDEDRKFLLTKLIAARGFEHFLHTKYVGQKRFSLEGGESLIPLLETIIEEAGNAGAEEIVMGMPHRGRLNVLANVLGKPYEMIFSEFEGSFLRKDVQGDGDVKYHLGYARDHTTRTGRKVHVSLLSNPSHLEAINPVVEGVVRAKQHYRRDRAGDLVMPLLIHGDAAFTGQGLVLETLFLSGLEGYRTGGTIHVIINNQIGFTECPPDYRFTPYASDLAKVIEAPVFHVNADDPEAAVQAARLAVGFRNAFKKDVIIDLICYRRHGHNETDDPSFTQPLMYQEISRHRPAHELYCERLVAQEVVTGDEVERIAGEYREIFDDALNYARDFRPRQQVFALGGVWTGMTWAGDDWSAHTAVPLKTLQQVADGARRLPDGFTPHPKVQRLLDERAAMLGRDGKIDWGCAEMLAFGTLLLEGTSVRLSGEDSERGTFSHRHAVLHDQKTAAEYVPLDHLSPDQGRFYIIDSMLSEAGVLGFEYGFSSADPRNLVIWEAQFGDFANGAQVIIDQFIACAESKWQRMSGLVLLLPHGYEGQGPEHSSARLERYLQLCAENNMQVCNLTTPAQYFHVLRRQMHRRFRKPLVIMSPKSLLRHKLAVSAPRDLVAGGFQTVIPETEAINAREVQRVLLCSGKVYYDLAIARRERGIEQVAIVRVEQLYPFPAAEIRAALQTYPATAEVRWVQEEPENMGAYSFMAHHLPPLLGGRTLGYVGREAAASPAVGSYKLHEAEQTEVVDRALKLAPVRVVRKAHAS
jgi:2-oxoglutarate dehydrogenase E1 component